jgi:hypothetical protein
MLLITDLFYPALVGEKETGLSMKRLLLTDNSSYYNLGLIA